ncbi:unnamed protein product [Clonostachys chloroleuca]|uniref:Uncharacterized protein n=1 Tax=Clonostachys chloroleuca TaxID=1926264 RepID=A0AA35M1Y1_9HYPO|nr:unnamed protein product [Clonostachys chloroleuca]
MIAENLVRMQDMPTFRMPQSDSLYRSEYPHCGGADCANCDPAALIGRRARINIRQVTVHYGTIASGNMLPLNRSVVFEVGGVSNLDGHKGERSGLKLWDSRSNSYKHSVSTNLYINKFAISPDGRLVGVSMDVIELLDSDLSPIDTQFKCDKDLELCSVAFSPDGRQIAAGLRTGTVLIWDSATGALLLHWLVMAEWCPQLHGKQLAGTGDCTTVWDLVSGRCLFSTDYCTAEAVFLHGSKLVTVKYTDILIWNTEKGGHSPRLLSKTDATVTCLRFVKWRCQDIRSNYIQSLLGYTGPVISLSFSPEKRILASASDDETIHITTAVKMLQTPQQVAWNAPKHDTPMKQDSQSHSGQVKLLEFSPDGKWLASAAIDKTVKIWDVASFTCIRTLATRLSLEAYASLFHFSPDGRWLLLNRDSYNNACSTQNLGYDEFRL